MLLCSLVILDPAVRLCYSTIASGGYDGAEPGPETKNCNERNYILFPCSSLRVSNDGGFQKCFLIQWPVKLKPVQTLFYNLLTIADQVYFSRLPTQIPASSHTIDKVDLTNVNPISIPTSNRTLWLAPNNTAR